MLIPRDVLVERNLPPALITQSIWVVAGPVQNPGHCRKIHP